MFLKQDLAVNNISLSDYPHYKLQNVQFGIASME